jgi:hypothetical protein
LADRRHKASPGNQLRGTLKPVHVPYLGQDENCPVE